MSFNIEIENNGQYLIVTVSGERNSESIVEITKEVIKACKNNSINDVIVDITKLEGRLSIDDSYSFAAKDIPNLLPLDSVGKAFLVDSKKNDERLRFFERIVQNLGINIQVSTDIKEAIKLISIEEDCKVK